jgi:CHAT domain-containing protein
MAESQTIAGTTLEGICQAHKAQFEKAQAEWQAAIARSRQMETQARLRASQSMSEEQEHQAAHEQQQAAQEELQGTRVAFGNARTAIRTCHTCNRPDFLPDEPTYQGIARAAAPEQALLYLAATNKGGAAFLIPPEHQSPHGDTREPIAIPLPRLSTPTVNNWIALRDEELVHQGGYGLALRDDGFFLLGQWAISAGDTNVQKQRLATPVGDLLKSIPAPMVTLRAIVEDMVAAWSQVAENPSHDSVRQQEQARMYRDWLATPLQEALSRSDIRQTVSHDLRRLLLHRELQQLPHALGKTFMAELRTGLDAHGFQDSDQAMALIPCGRLSVLPLNAAWVRSNPQKHEDISFQETCILTYQASARSLAVARQRAESLPLEGPLLTVGDPTSALPSLPGARLEAQICVTIAKKQKNREDSISILGAHATLAQVNAKLEEIREKRAGTILLIAAHGHVDPGNPRKCYMQLAGNEQARLTLIHLQQSHLLEGVRLFIASGCVTGQGDFRKAPDEISSFAAGVLEAGAAGVLATQWSVNDYAAFLLSVRFTQLLLDNLERSPAWAIREAARWLRTLTLAELQMMRRGIPSPLSHEIRTEDIPALVRAIHGDTMRGAPAPDLPDIERLTMGDVVRNLTPLFAEEEHPFAHPFYWAPVIVYGA